MATRRATTRRAGALTSLLALCCGLAVAGAPRIECTWVEALPGEEFLYHGAVDLAEAPQDRLRLVVQFRLADPQRTTVKSQDAGRDLLFWPAQWQRPAEEPAGRLVWRPPPFKLTASLLADEAKLPLGKTVCAIFDLYDPGAQKYVASGFPLRAMFHYRSREGKPSLEVVPPNDFHPYRDRAKEPAPAVLWPKRQEPEEVKLAPELRAYGLPPARAFGGAPLRHGSLKGPDDQPGVPSVGFTRDGRAVLAGGPDGTVTVWGAESGLQLRRLRGRVLAAGNGRTLVLSQPQGADGAKRSLLDPQTGNRVAALADVPRLVVAARLSQDAERLMVFGPKGLGLWNVASGARQQFVPLEVEHNEGSADRQSEGYVSPSGCFVATSIYSQANVVQVFDTQRREKLFTGRVPAGHRAAVAVGAGGTRLAANQYLQGKGLCLFDAETGKELGSMAPLAACLDVSPDGSVLAVAGEGGISLHRAVDGGRLADLVKGEQGTHVRYSRDGRTLVGTTVRRAGTWDAATGRPLASRPAQGGISALSPDGSRAVTLTPDGFLEIWDPRSGSLLLGSADLRSPVLGLSVSGDGRRLAAKSKAGNVRVWDVATGRCLFAASVDQWPEDEGKTGATTVALSADGTTMAVSSSQGAPTVWDIDERRMKALLAAGEPGPSEVALSPDGRCVATTGSHCRVWDLDTMTAVLRRRMPAARAIAFGPHMKRLAVADGGPQALSSRIRQCDFADRGPFRPLGPNPTKGIAYSPDGKLLACGRGLIDTATGKAVRQFDLVAPASPGGPPPLPPEVLDYAFSPDGRKIAAALGDAGVRIFDREVHGVEARLAGPLGFCCAAFSADGEWLVTGCTNGAVIAWKRQ
ncbi:MAG: WD40 repeat domain-containing protein [bacterium]